MIYSITDGKLIPAEKPANHSYNNLPVGTIINYSGDMANHSAQFVVIERRQNLPRSSVYYQCIAREDYRDKYKMIAGFNCLKNYENLDAGEAIYNRKSEDHETVLNALAWFAGEEVARAYVDVTEQQ